MSKKLTNDQLEYAKGKYMKYTPVAEIARELNVSRLTLQNYVNNSWKSERVLLSNQLSAELADSKAASITKIFSSSYKGLESWVKKVTAPSYEMKPHEAKTLMSIIESMDKITRLDQGSPTDIISDTKPISVVEIREKILNADPFQIEDANFKEIEDAGEAEESH